MTTDAFSREFLEVSRRQLQTRCERIEACLAKLSDEHIWAREHEIENAVGNLVLHVCGNVTQWILGGVGGLDVPRDRDTEFARRDPIPRAELAGRLRDTVRRADAVLARVSSDQLLEPRSIQGYDVTILHAIYHVVEHFAEHAGQIISATKRMTGEDLGFYGSLRDATNVTPGATP